MRELITLCSGGERFIIENDVIICTPKHKENYKGKLSKELNIFPNMILSRQPVVDEFRGEYFFLSNFYITPVVYKGEKYPSSEHAYMSEKSEDKWWKEFCLDPKNTPGQVKKKSKTLPERKYDKFQVMREVLESKFSDQSLLNMLKSLPERTVFYERNSWGDLIWGVNNNLEGENNLGRMLNSLFNGDILDIKNVIDSCDEDFMFDSFTKGYTSFSSKTYTVELIDVEDFHCGPYKLNQLQHLVGHIHKIYK